MINIIYRGKGWDIHWNETKFCKNEYAIKFFSQPHDEVVLAFYVGNKIYRIGKITTNKGVQNIFQFLSKFNPA